jgi:hypothetical protein
MLYRINNFEQKTPSEIEFNPFTLACGETINIYTIKTVHDLTQFIGFGKYINNHEYNVFLRGQTGLYNGTLIPSLYRGKTRNNTITDKYNRRIKSIKRVSTFAKYDKEVLEPLLQHYGIRTPHIDLVDNVWVALWFALHQAKSKVINSHEYIYFYENQCEYSYILLIATDAINTSGDHGLYEGSLARLVDLRKSLPSYFLRPHAQHAYMLRKLEPYPNDYSDLIIGIAQIPTDLGLKWLGNNEFLTVRSLFPATYFDSGYAIILKNYPEDNQSTVNQYGSIQILTD